MLRRNHTKPIEPVLNWSGISTFLTGNADNIRQFDIPKKYMVKIDLLLYYIKCWKQGKRLYSMEEIDKILSNFNLKDEISGKFEVLD